MTNNLFSKAKKLEPKVKKSIDEKIRLTVEDSSFFDKVEKLSEFNDQIKYLKSKVDLFSDQIRDIAKKEWINHYDKTNMNPGTVIVEHIRDNDVAQVMFVPSDKYITIDEVKADELREQYGEEIVEEETTFSFDSKMIEKYGEIISTLIENCDDIDKDDKDKIVKATTKFSVSKGTINKIKEYDNNVELMIENIKPVFSLKSVEIIKG